MSVQNPATALEALITSRVATAAVVMAAWDRVNDDFRLRRVELSSSVAEEFSDIALTAVRSLSGVRLRVFDAANRPDDDVVQYLHLDQSPELSALFDDLSGPGRLDRLGEDQSFLRDLKFYSIAIRSGDERAVLVRSYGKARSLSQSRLFGIYYTGDVYDKVDDTALLFDHAVDAIAYQGVLYILNEAQFRRMFRIAEALRSETVAALSTITARFPVLNHQDLEHACLGQVQMMAKAIQIPRKPYFQKLTLADVKRTIARFDLSLKTAMVNGEEALVFEKSLEQRWLILKVLDDDFLESDMTDLQYEVSSKASLG